MKIIITLLLFAFSSLNAQNNIDSILKKYNQEKNVPYVSVQEARSLQLQNQVIFLDAREKEEFMVSKLPQAHYVGFQDFSKTNLNLIIPKDSLTIVVYCSIGVRSHTIAKKLIDLGFKNIKNLYGGIFEWKNNNFPVLDRNNEETEKVHAFSKTWGVYLNKGEKIYNTPN